MPDVLLSYALLGYGLRVLTDYRRYARYLNDNFSDPERSALPGCGNYSCCERWC